MLIISQQIFPRIVAGKPQGRNAIVTEKTPNNWSDEETFDPNKADGLNFYKVEKWTADGTRVDGLLYAGNNLTRAQHVFSNALRHRPRIRLTIRQRTRVLQQWPVE
jgi:hypothetical protein